MRDELYQLAEKLGFNIQHDCGGFRVVKDNSYIYPNTGICPTATKKECYIFLLGFKEAVKGK